MDFDLKVSKRSVIRFFFFSSSFDILLNPLRRETGMGKQGDRFFSPFLFSNKCQVWKVHVVSLVFTDILQMKPKKYKYLKGLATAVQS